MENQKKVVLVLEDEYPLLRAIKIELEKSNFNVVTARSVTEAEKYVYELSHIDVIWLDHSLVGQENGLDFIKWFKQEDDERYKQVPIFVVSNLENDEQIAIYRKLGAEKFFLKSNYKLGEIIKEINENLSKKSNI